MIRKEVISDTLDSQNKNLNKSAPGYLRENLKNIPVIDSFATIITGVRRCGKSTLMTQLMRNQYAKNAIFLNFEDIRLTGFEAQDFSRLHEEVVRRQVNTLFLDEVQIVPGWEIYVNQLLREKYRVFITGSNASMLSHELGSHLTGRQISMELFPFSYTEFLNYKKLSNRKESVNKYLVTGGFPEYVKNSNDLILSNLLNDILIRDIAVRYAIRDIESLRKLAIYLISNVGKAVSATKLSGTFGIKSVSTTLEYFAHMQNAYLIEFLPQFSYSLKAQNRNPKKVYTVDTGLINVVSSSLSEDLGRKFENLIYLHLRRFYPKIFYFKDKGECDFVVFDNEKVVGAVQVSYLIDDHNFDWEVNGLLEAMRAFKLKKAYLISMEQEDRFTFGKEQIIMLSANKFLSNRPFQGNSSTN